jgi:hypothetical protein
MPGQIVLTFYDFKKDYVVVLCNECTGLQNWLPEYISEFFSEV